MIADGYKDTVIGVIPIEWDVVNTDDVVKVGAGTGFKVDYQGCLDKPTPFYKVSDMNSLGNEVFMNRANNYVDDKDISILKAKIFPKNTLVFPKVGAALLTNKRRILSVEACVDNNIMTLVPKKDRINITFLYSHYLQIDFNDFSNDGALPSINASQVKNFKIPLPPLKEQEKIADILSTVDDKIDAIASQVQKAETLKKGLLQKLLSEGIGHSEFKDSELGKIPESWEVEKLENLTTKIGDGLHGTPKYVEQSDFYFINGNNLTGKDIKITKNTKCVSEDEYYKNKKILDNTTILLSINGTIGSLAYYNSETVMLGKSVAYMNINDEILKEFLFYILKSSKIIDYFLLELTGTTIKNLSLKTIRNTKIPLPPLEEQKQIADILSTADEKLEVLRAKKEKHETLKKGLMQKLLSGEVRVKI